MATKSISQLDTQATANETDLFEVAIVDANSASGYASKKESAAAIADAIVGEYQFPLRITGTTAKTIAGAINELKNLVDLLPQFAIEVVQTLPVSDISTTTIYLVPASDPEQGNYYEEYIYVNNAWELVGTTAVDLSGYYTSAQVDTLLAAKANTSSLATVATSGAYSDLSGKPTIDTALDTTSTNAVENRAVASEINSIKSDITVDGSASGDIATFADGSDNPLKELKISIEAVQSGSGDPSPTNVRPISGFSAVDITRAGKNLLPTFTEEPTVEGLTLSVDNGKITLNGTVSQTTVIRTAFGTFMWDGITDCWLSGCPSGGSYDSGYSLRVDGSKIADFSIADTGAGIKLQPSDNANLVGIPLCFTIVLRVGTYNNITFAPMLNFGISALPYEPYNGNTYNINWQSEANTVYGGTLNVKTGVLTVTHAIIDMGDLNYTYNDAMLVFAAAINGMYNGANGNVTTAICSCYKAVSYNYIASSSHTEKMFSARASSVAGGIIVKDLDYTDPTAFKTAVAGQKIVYPLVTPVTYQLTPTEIRSLLGVNNVWANCGAITELKYIRDLNLCINDIIARIEALEGGSNTRSLSLSPTLTKSLTSDSDTAEGKTEEETEEETKEEAQKNER